MKNTLDHQAAKIIADCIQTNHHTGNYKLLADCYLDKCQQYDRLRELAQEYNRQCESPYTPYHELVAAETALRDFLKEE